MCVLFSLHEIVWTGKRKRERSGKVGVGFAGSKEEGEGLVCWEGM